MTSGGSLLAVFAHPDDESLLVAGTIAAAAAAGVACRLVCATRGELGPGSPDIDLGSARLRELDAAGTVLGASTTCLELKDGWLSSSTDDLELRLSAEFARFQPATIITFARDGWYWHPDHVAVHEAVIRAAAAVAPSATVVGATWPTPWMKRLVRAARRRELPDDPWGLDPAAFGSPAADIDLVVQLDRWLEPKIRALHSHETQLAAAPMWRALPAELRSRYLGVEFFSVLRGSAVALLDAVQRSGGRARLRRRGLELAVQK